jgi:hypothetical protein
LVRTEAGSHEDARIAAVPYGSDDNGQTLTVGAECQLPVYLAPGHNRCCRNDTGRAENAVNYGRMRRKSFRDRDCWVINQKCGKGVRPELPSRWAGHSQEAVGERGWP